MNFLLVLLNHLLIPSSLGLECMDLKTQCTNSNVYHTYMKRVETENRLMESCLFSAIQMPLSVKGMHIDF